MNKGLSKFEEYKNKIALITSNIGNVCNINENGMCADNVTEWRKPKHLCCDGCEFHSPSSGCFTENLVCMAWYCDYLKKRIDAKILNELDAIIEELLNIGLEARQSKEQQLAILSKLPNHEG